MSTASREIDEVRESRRKVEALSRRGMPFRRIQKQAFKVPREEASLRMERYKLQADRLFYRSTAIESYILHR